MKVLLLNASPRKLTSTSNYFLSVLNTQMAGCETERISLSGPKVYPEIFSQFATIDALVIAMPVYVDGIPSHVLRFLTQAEEYCQKNGCKFTLYVLANCGFYEPQQCRLLLNMMRSFCKAAGLKWGAGLGIGAGEMLKIMTLTIGIFQLVKLGLSALVFLLQGNFIGGFANYSWLGFLIPMTIYLVFSSGLFFALWKMKRAIKKGKSIPNFYTGLLVCPRFLMTIYANDYWIKRAALNGVGFWELYNTNKWKIESNKTIDP